jgi:hypothetical protein
MLYAGTLRDFWYGLNSAGRLNFGLAIIGFSLSLQDNYMRQLLYRIVKNYQETNWNEEFFGRKKRPLVLVDKRKSRDQEDKFRSRYAFVDWSKAHIYMDGFDEHAIEMLLEN